MRRLALATLLIAVGCVGGGPSGTATEAIIGFPRAEGTLRVEVADSVREQRHGLMERTQLPPDGGMVFVYGEPVLHSFVMRNTLIPLSIAFWDEHGRIVEIIDMVPCEAEPCAVYRPREAFVAAVETRAGWFAEHGIEVGDRVEVRTS